MRSSLALAVGWLLLAALRLSAPSPETTPSDPAPVGLLSLGSPARAATLAWWQIGRAWASGGDVDPEQLAHTVRRIGRLDPQWRTPWVYGGLMLQALDQPAVAEGLLREGAARWPDDPWFPAALGVHLQDAGRIDEARDWLRQARERS